MKKILHVLIALSAISLLTGCNIIRMTGTTGSTNIGRALLDLHEAHEKGLLSEADYERLKNQILEESLREEEIEADG